MKFILGKKVGMTELYDEKSGRMAAVTAVAAEPCYVAQVKTSKKNRVSAVQVAFGIKRKVSRARKGHLGAIPAHRHLREFRLSDDAEAERYGVGDRLSVTSFVPGETVTVSGVAKGRGFQGVVKRHGFHGSPKTHGHKDQLRMPGSIGATDPQHVFKGTRMAGHMGAHRVTVSGLTVLKVDEEHGLLYLGGAVPGPKGGLLAITGIGAMTVAKREEVASAQSNGNG